MQVTVNKYATKTGFFRKAAYILELQVAFDDAEKRILKENGMHKKTVLYVRGEDCSTKNGATFEISKLIEGEAQAVAFSRAVLVQKYELELEENLEALRRLLPQTGRASKLRRKPIH